MVAQGPPSLHESVRRRDFAALIRRFDAELQLYIDGEGSEKLPILLNRSTSYYQLRLFRKALKVGAHGRPNWLICRK